MKLTERGNLEGHKLDAHQKSDGESVRSDSKKLDSFTLETSKNHLIRSFLRNGRLRVKLFTTTLNTMKS